MARNANDRTRSVIYRCPMSQSSVWSPSAGDESLYVCWLCCVLRHPRSRSTVRRCYLRKPRADCATHDGKIGLNAPEKMPTFRHLLPGDGIRTNLQQV